MVKLQVISARKDLHENIRNRKADFLSNTKNVEKRKENYTFYPFANKVYLFSDIIIIFILTFQVFDYT